MNLSIPIICAVLFGMPAGNKATGPAVEKPAIISNAPLSPAQAAHGRISAVEFKAQQFCRVELKDFDFDAKFTVVSATAYFSGANFTNPQIVPFTGSSLKPLEKMKGQCVPGSLVVFDNIKVKGPDNEVRTIEAVSYLLY